MIVLDTHVLLWWLGDAKKLSAAARRALRAVNAQDPAIVSAISVLEIATAARRGRLVLTMPVEDWLADVRLLPEVRFQAVGADIAQRAGLFGAQWHGDPADRLIAATALTLSVPLVSADAHLQGMPGLKTIW